MVLSAKTMVMGRGPENWHFSFLAAPGGEAWAVLSSPSL